MFKRVRNWLLFWSIRIFLGLFRLLPYRFASALGAGVGAIAYYLAATPRTRALAHLQLALDLTPEASRQLAKRLFRHFGRAACEAICVDQACRPSASYVRLTPRTQALFDDLKQRGQGAIVVTGHFGNWEVMAAATAALGYPVHTIARRAFEPRINALIETFRNSRGVHTILRGDHQLKQKVADALGAGGFLALFIDQDIRGVRGTFVPFFGRPAYTPTGAAYFAKLFGVPVLVGGSRRLDGAMLEIDFERVDTDWSDTDAATALLTARLEALIRRDPEQWAWMHRRWKTRPDDLAANRP